MSDKTKIRIEIDYRVDGRATWFGATSPDMPALDVSAPTLEGLTAKIKWAVWEIRRFTA